jgi:hypothetical protein
LITLFFKFAHPMFPSTLPKLCHYFSFLHCIYPHFLAVCPSFRVYAPK